MIRIIIDVRHVSGIRRDLVSLNELDLHGYEIRNSGGSMEVLHDDMTIIRGIMRGGFNEMIGIVEFASTVIPVDTPIYRVIGGGDMTGCGGGTTVEI
jgi:hypothetical protein